MSIHLRDGDPMVAQKVATLGGAILISVVTRVELEGGDYREPAHAHIRRARLDVMLSGGYWSSTSGRPATAAIGSEPEIPFPKTARSGTIP